MTTLTIQQAFELAVKHHAAGGLPQAEGICRQILSIQPDHLSSLKMLAQLSHQMGQPAAAAELLQRAIAIAPGSAELHSNLGMMLAILNRPEEAVAALRKAMSLGPASPHVLNNLGNILGAQGKPDEALAAYHEAARLDPAFPETYNNLGALLAGQRRYPEAVGALRQAVALRPDRASSWFNLGKALEETCQFQEAITAFSRAVSLDPGNVEVRTSLGNALWEAGRIAEAIPELREALRLRPSYPEALVNLANCLADDGQPDQALELYRQAIAQEPQLAEALHNMGNLLKGEGRLDEALDAYEQALVVRPDYAEAYCNIASTKEEQGHPGEALAAYAKSLAANSHLPTARFNLGLMLLRDGNFEEGLELYEARRGIPKLRCDRDFPQPIWDGSELNGRRILLHAEQGLGDTIQFVRYVPMVRARGGEVIVQCQPPLRMLLEGQCGIGELLTDDEPVPSFDVHCPMMSLPRLFGTRIGTIPVEAPYLRADPRRAERWREMIPGDGERLNVGLVWAGSPDNKNDRKRSVRLADLAPLAQAPGVRFHSLQKGDAASQAQAPPAGMNLTDWSERLTDFVETAALISNLDLVITVDTAAAHLAGAMGKPVWVLIPFNPDWRWLHDRTDSPWYPTMRLFRQARAGAWGEVIAGIARGLTNHSVIP